MARDGEECTAPPQSDPVLRAAPRDALTQGPKAVPAADREIDALVYELYGLTEEEMAIVEALGH